MLGRFTRQVMFDYTDPYNLLFWGYVLLAPIVLLIVFGTDVSVTALRVYGIAGGLVMLALGWNLYQRHKELQQLLSE